jgi:tetratricopeptide (TPR) repeat protein
MIVCGGCLSSQRTVTSRGETIKERQGPGEKPRETAADRLARARTLKAQGDYEGALRESQRALALAGKNPPADEALFSVGLLHALPGNPRRDLDKSLSAFKRLVSEHPGSSRADEAKAWVGILQENERLQNLIQQSKKVDVEVEEKRRERGGK